jgi:hypothetical protein
MVADADVMLSNFKPGTLESLGLGYEELAQINPRLIAVESSAFGRTGPWSKRMGYGPLVRAAAGLTAMWRYPDDDESFSDSVTIYPDHVCARIGASAVMALLARRQRTGRGGHADVAQAEVMLAHLAAEIASGALGLPAQENPHSGVFACAGEDEWCVVTPRDDADRQRLAAVIGPQSLAEWLAERNPQEAAEALQAAGVPAAPMLRAADLADHPYYTARGLFRSEPHDLLPEPMTAERRPGDLARDSRCRWPPCPAHVPGHLRRDAGLARPHRGGMRFPRSGGRARNDASENPRDGRHQVLSGDCPMNAAASPAVLTERRGNVLLVTINRPEARNAVNAAVHLGIGEALELAEHDPELRVVILTGAGEKRSARALILSPFRAANGWRRMTRRRPRGDLPGSSSIRFPSRLSQRSMASRWAAAPNSP